MKFNGSKAKQFARLKMLSRSALLKHRFYVAWIAWQRSIATSDK